METKDMEFEKLIEYLQKNINLADFCTKHYGAKFINSKSLCIFHDEKTPSFHYHAETNTVCCYAKCYMKEINKIKNIKVTNDTSFKLNIFNVVALKEGLVCHGEDFIKIIKIICEKEKVEYNFKTKKVNTVNRKLYEEKSNLAKRYIDNLKNNKNHMIHTYLINDREIKPQIIADFFLGLTFNNESVHGKRYMSERLSIPILNDDGSEVLAISVRQLSGSDKEPKYLHDETDEIWQKGNVLYGYAHAKKYIKETNHVYIVEGFFDMISLYQAGIKNSLAIMSNIITIEQIAKIKKITNNVTFILDQDEAGIKGFSYVFEKLLKHGLNVRVIPNLKFKGKDANDLCKKLKWDEVEIKNFLTSCSKDAIHYVLSDIYDAYDSTIMNARDQALRASLHLLSLITDDVKKQNYKHYIDNRLGV